MDKWYQVVRNIWLYQVEAEVNQLILDNWEPIGGITISRERVNEEGQKDSAGQEVNVFHQAMRRKLPIRM